MFESQIVACSIWVLLLPASKSKVSIFARQSRVCC
jgi:hypothetical protein